MLTPVVRMFAQTACLSICLLASAAHAQTRELPMPAIPDDMERSKRPAYVAEHFWDALEFTDTTLTHNREFMEVNIVNFLYLLSYADTAPREKALTTVFEKLSTDPEALNRFIAISETYLSDPASPVYNEEIHLTSLRQLLKLASLPAELRLRTEFQLDMAQKNRPGTKATDFSFSTDNSGTATRKLSAATDTTTILIFYDPECDHCVEALHALSDSKTVNTGLREHSLKVIAVYTESDRELWNRTRQTLPAGWTVGFDESDIIENDLYYIQSMPAIYLLDSHRRVILKNTTVSAVEQYLARQ